MATETENTAQSPDEPNGLAPEAFCVIDLEKIGHPKKKAFIVAFARLGNITRAARVAKIHRNTHSTWLKDDPDYNLAFTEARAVAVELLEAEADRRAVRGVKEPVYQGGKLVGFKQRYSDLLLITRLNALAPEKYRRKLEVVPEDGPRLIRSPLEMPPAPDKEKLSTGEISP